MSSETVLVRILVLVALISGTTLGVGPLRRWCVAHPRSVLTAIVAFDVLMLLYATTPFVVSGYDEAQFLIAAHHLRGADLDVAWIRTPLPVMAIAAFPWHPAVPGILAKQLATILTYMLLRNPLGVGLALFGALFASSAEELVGNTCEAVSEPFGAAALTGFALAVVRGGPLSLFATATLGSLSRWQLIWLLPVAAVLSWRRRGWRSTLALTLIAAVCVAVCLWITGVDPWRSLVQERQRDHTVIERLAFYLSPKVGLGLGPVGMLLLLIGAVALIRERSWTGLTSTAVLFFVYLAGIASVGVIVPRFLAPAVPLACVLAVRGIAKLLECVPRLAEKWPSAVAATIVIVASAIPVHQPRMRERKLTSPQAPVALDLAAVLAALGNEVPYSDVDAQKMRATLGRRCIAVGTGHAETVDGLVARDQVPKGSLYFTADPAGRLPIWSHGGLMLVRW